MGRYCYCSKVLEGQEEAIRNHWRLKQLNSHGWPGEVERAFWSALGMTGFESWLHRSKEGSYYIHCLEGASKERIFAGLRGQIAQGNRCALDLQAFYIQSLGKDYLDPSSEPEIEQVLDLELPQLGTSGAKKGVFYPLLDGKEVAYRKLCTEAAEKKRPRHEAVMRAANVSRLTTWIQTLPDRKQIVIYTERANERSRPGKNREWEEVARALMAQTGLVYEELTPEVEWLNRGQLNSER